MGTTDNYISVMIDSLNKKVVLLNKIVEENANQREILLEESFNQEAFEQNIEDKAELIEQLTMLDDGFVNVYNRVKEILDKDRAKYTDEIKTMQDLVAQVTDLSVQVQSEESRNKTLVEKQFSILKREIKQSKQSGNVASNYYKTMSRIDTEPQLLDKKK